MPSIKVLLEDASARVGYDLVQESFGPGAPGTLQVVVDQGSGRCCGCGGPQDPGIAAAMPTVRRRQRAGGMIQAVPIPVWTPRLPRRRSTDCAPTRRPRPWSAGGGREPDPEVPARRPPTPPVLRVVLRARVPAPADRPAGAAHLAAGTPREPAVHRGGVRVARLVSRRAGAPRSWARSTRASRRLGAGLLLRDDLRDRDGLHRVLLASAKSTTRPRRPAGRDGRRVAHPGGSSSPLPR